LKNGIKFTSGKSLHEGLFFMTYTLPFSPKNEGIIHNEN
jgi:hypothetical protein